ncbi:hypothetical protein AGMMS4957_06550 [Bacteroidia bacterium]|nr:hypothetical protein AGMMS4957_06550 [Bacteroidia bacterium]
MKNRIFALLALVCVASSCKEDAILVPTALYVGEETTFTLSANGETREIEVNTTANLRLEKEETDWCTVELAGNKKLVVTVKPNEKIVGRNSILTLHAPDRKLDVTIAQRGQPNIAMKVVSATASSSAAGYSIDVSYDGDLGNGFFVTAVDAAATHELTYVLEPTNELQLVGVTYYPRLPNANGTVANGNIGTGTVWIAKNATPTNFEKVRDFDLEKTIKTAFIEFPSPITDVYAVKITADGSASQANSFSCREIVLNGTGIRTAPSKFVIPEKSLLSFSNAGSAATVSVLTNSTSITATSDAAWCSISIDGSFVNVSVSANTGDRRTANITVTGSEGGSQTITVRQLAPSAMLAVTAADATPTSLAEGAIGNMWDGKVDANYWHSDYSANSLSTTGPYTLEFTLANVSKLSHIRYYPRQAATVTRDTEGNNQGGNGNFGRIEVLVKTTGNYTKVMDFRCGEKGAMSEIVLPTPIDNATGVQILLHSGRGGHGSCAEMEFYGSQK